MYYPKEVFSYREDVTRANMREYEKRQRQLEEKCLEIDPNYYHLGLRQRMEIRTQAEKEMEA